MLQAAVYQITFMLVAMLYMSVTEKLCLIYDFTCVTFKIYIPRENIDAFLRPKMFEQDNKSSFRY